MPETIERNVRVQILVPPRSALRLDRLIKETESSSAAEVVRNALKLYEAVIDGARKGQPFFQMIDGRLSPVVMVGPYAADVDDDPKKDQTVPGWKTAAAATKAQLEGERLDKVALDPRDGWTWRFMAAVLHEVGPDGRTTESAVSLRSGMTRGALRPWIEAGIRQGVFGREDVDSQPGIALTHAGWAEWRSNSQP